MLSHFSPHDVAALLGIATGRLKYWRKIGLVSPSTREKGKVRYDFQDLICLKTAQGLVEKGIQATRIKRSIASLKRRFPDLDEQLADKRIYVFGNRAVVSHRNRLVDTESGQLLFNFDVRDLARRVDRRMGRLNPGKTAQDWFEEGLRYDSDKTTYPLAMQAYQEALRLDPGFADACVNIGNIYYNQRQLDEAERFYQHALTENCSHAKAYFNLGNVMDEMNRSQEALEYYRKSLALDPAFADAYYNLAATCEKLALWEEAAQYWESYLDLDSHSSHAGLARRRVRLLRSGLVKKRGPLDDGAERETARSPVRAGKLPARVQP